MKLIYVYIKSEKRKIENGINFSSSYSCEYDAKRGLTISKKESKQIENFYGSNIKNMNLIIGNNGVGKSTFLEVLYKELYMHDSNYYFIVYHYEGNIFYIEQKNINIFSNSKVNSIFNDAYCKLENNKLIKIDFVSTNKNIYEVLYKKRNNMELVYDIFDIYKDTDTCISKNSTIHKSKIKNTLRNLYLFANNATDNLSVPNFINDLELTITFDDWYHDSKDFSPYFLYNFENDIELINTKKCNSFILLFLDAYIFTNLRSIYGLDIKDKLCTININQNNISYETIKKLLLNSMNELFYSNQYHSKLINDLIELFESIPDEFYYPKDKQEISLSIVFKLKSKEAGSFIEKLDNIQKNNYVSNTINSVLNIYVKNLSDGEAAYIDMYSSIYSSVVKNDPKEKIDYLIVLDEPDSNFHPEWSRQLVNNIVDITNSICENYPNIKFEYVISSHSPILVSDFMRDNITILKRNQHENKLEILKSEYGLLSNIGTIFEKSFFLEAAYGEYAMKFFNENVKNKEMFKVLNAQIDNELIKYFLKGLFNND